MGTRIEDQDWGCTGDSDPHGLQDAPGPQLLQYVAGLPLALLPRCVGLDTPAVVRVYGGPGSRLTSPGFLSGLA